MSDSVCCGLDLCCGLAVVGRLALSCGVCSIYMLHISVYVIPSSCFTNDVIS